MTQSRRSSGNGARSELIERHLPLVRSVAQRYRGSGEPLDDLVQVGTIGLIKAIDRFDPNRGHELSTLAVPAIDGEIRHHLRDKASVVRTPRPVQELAGRVRKAQARLAAELGREPGHGELAEAVGAPEEEVAFALAAGPPSSLDERAEEPADGRSTEEATEQRVLLERGFDQLPERDRTILRLRYEDDLSQSDIARRVGVSQATVSRVIRDALERLRETMQAGGVAEQESGAYSRAMASSPEPADEERPTHSGRLLVRMPGSLHAELARVAEREGVSLNTLVTGALAGAVGWRDAEGELPALGEADGSAPAHQRPRWLRAALVANVVVVALAAIAAIALLIAAWSSGW